MDWKTCVINYDHGLIKPCFGWPIVQMCFIFVVKFCSVLKETFYFDCLLQYLRVTCTNYNYQFSSEQLIAGNFPGIYENSRTVSAVLLPPLHARRALNNIMSQSILDTISGNYTFFHSAGWLFVTPN